MRGLPFFRPFPLAGLRRLGLLATIAAFALMSSGLRAANQAPVVGPGATREDVINAYGWPSGLSQAGTKEVLTYPQGRITLEKGRVERVDFSPNVPWPAPRPRPAPPTSSTAKRADPMLDFWLERFEDAQKEARRRNARILALFIGSDWSPPSRQFVEEVAFSPEFVNTFTGDFVFLRLDFPTRAPQPADIREQNVRLREAYGVTTYPALLVLSAAGVHVATIDLTTPRAGDTYLAKTIAAVAEVRDALVARPPPPDPVGPPVEAAVPPAESAAEPAPIGNAAVASSVGSATKLILGAIGVGLAVVAFGWWFLWRSPQDKASERIVRASERIADAASGLPPTEEILQWSRERLRGVVSRLAEVEGYQVQVRGGGGDGDLALMHPGQTAPGVIVSVQPGEAGQVSAKRVRELFGTITVEGVKTGWFVAPAGFSREARDYAKQHGVELIEMEHLLGQLRAAPPILLQKILAG